MTLLRPASATLALALLLSSHSLEAQRVPGWGRVDVVGEKICLPKTAPSSHPVESCGGGR